MASALGVALRALLEKALADPDFLARCAEEAEQIGDRSGRQIIVLDWKDGQLWRQVVTVAREHHAGGGMRRDRIQLRPGPVCFLDDNEG